MPPQKNEPSTRSGRILDVFLEWRNQTVTLAQISQDTGLNEGDIQRAIGNIRAKMRRREAPLPYTLDIVVRGRAWVLRDVESEQSPEPVPKKIFEEVGRTSDGAIIIRDDEDSLLYRVVPL